MAHQLDLKVVAEGVEETSQLNYLKEKNCDYIQGYLLAKPLKKDSLEEILIREEDEIYQYA
ncbi:EAL domain-containing protein [Halanaerobiaceae bacterium ANBcell28]